MKLKLRSYTSIKFSIFFNVLSIVAIAALGALITILFIRLIDESTLLRSLSIIFTAILIITMLSALFIKESSRRFVNNGFIIFEDGSIEISSGDSISRIEFKEIITLTVIKESYDGETEASWTFGGIVTQNGLGNSISIVTIGNKFRLQFYAESETQLRTLAMLLSEWKSKHELSVRFTDKRSNDLLRSTLS